MTAISIPILANAVARVNRMTFKQREALADEIHAQQPILFYSVLSLNNMGVSIEQIDLVLNMLLVFHQAMKTSGKTWPIISEDVQSRCLQVLCARMRFIEDLTPQQKDQVIAEATAAHPEQVLLAYTLDKFSERGQLGVETEAIKMSMLVALNLVECIAYEASR